MYRIANSANIIRKYYYTKYLEFKNNSKDSLELTKKLVNFLNELQTEDVDLFNTLIGLLFCDKYTLLGQTDSKLKEKYESINNLNELLHIIGNEPIIDVYSSISFFELSDLEKVKRINNINIEFFTKFSILNSLEKYLLFSRITLDQITSTCFKNMDKEEFSLDNKAINRFREQLEIRKLGNMTNFEEIIIEMIKILYTYKRNIYLTNNGSFTEYDKQFIETVEQSDRDTILEIIKNNDEEYDYLFDEYINLLKQHQIIDTDDEFLNLKFQGITKQIIA